jgi:PPOX class probable F420-dependent enzyme
MHPRELELLNAARRAILATVRADGLPRVLPICFAAVEQPDGLVVYSPIDEKPKRSGDPHSLARVRDIGRRPDVTVLVDRWDEDWRKLAWVQLRGLASVVEPGASEHKAAIELLRARYAQYERQGLESRPIIRIDVGSVRSWFAVLPYGEPL